MAHPFFRTVDWERLREGRCTLPLLLRDRLLAGAAGELGAWRPPPPPRGGANKPAPIWLAEF